MGVRREKVILEVDSNISRTVMKDAFSVKYLARELQGLSGQAVITSRATRNISRDTDNVERSSARASATINQLTGRLRLFADVAAILGPALVPIGAVALPAVTGLANQLGVAALAGGTAIIAFQGVGDALKAVNEAALEPTAENLLAAQVAMENLAPAAQEMVSRLQELRPVLSGLRDAAAEGLFPGVIEGLDELERRVPEVERILSNVASTMGDGFADAADSLASGRWDEFFDFLATEAPQTLSALGKTVGSLTHGMAELWMAFDPLNDDFSGWMQNVARGFDSWATGLDQTEGFREFIEYVRESGPQVADTFGALGNAVLQIVQASAPLGGPVLKALESVANVIASIADSDLGTPLMTAALAFATWNRGAAAWAGISGAVLSGFDKVGGSATVANKGLSLASKGILAVAASFVVLEAANSALNFAESDGDIRRMIASLGEGQGLRGQVEATSAALREQKQIMDDARGLNLGVTKLWSTDAAANAAEKYDALTEHMKDLQAQVPTTYGRMQSLGQILAGNLNPALDESADQFRLATMGAEDFTRALARMAGFLDKREALRNYQQSLDDFAKSVRENGKSFNRSTEAGRANEQALDGIADSALTLAQQLKGMDRIKTLTQAASDIRALAKQLGIPQREVDVLIDKLLKAARTDAKPEVKPQGIPEANRDVDGVQRKFNILDQFTANPGMRANDNASGPIGWVQSALNNLDGDQATVTITTVRETINRITTFQDFMPWKGSADGGTVPKTGRHYADRHPYLLADGEEVISNRHGQADRNRQLLKAINANRMADGGTVMVPAASSPSVSVTASTGPVTATARLHPDDIRAIGAEVRAGAYDGTSQRLTAQQRNMHTTRRA